MAALLMRNRSRKKNAGPKKVPQRGMGVAQLERELDRMGRTPPRLEHQNFFIDRLQQQQQQQPQSNPAAMQALRNLMSKQPQQGDFIGVHPMWASSKPDSSSPQQQQFIEAFLRLQQQQLLAGDALRGKFADSSTKFHPQQHRELSLYQGNIPSLPKELSSFQTKCPGNIKNTVWPSLPPKAAPVVLQKRPYDQDHPSPRSSASTTTSEDAMFHRGSTSSTPLQLLGKRGHPSTCYVESPPPKRFAGGDFLSLGLFVSEDSEQETVTSVEECNPRSPSYGSIDYPRNVVEIDLSLKL